MDCWTVGYGGRPPTDFVALLREHGVGLIVDVRLRPDRASMGAYVRAKDPTRGIEGLLTGAGIAYRSLIELGNPFVELPDWAPRYARLLAGSADLLLERLVAIDEPYCLMCAERSPEDCHRRFLAEALAARGYAFTHLR